MLYTMCDHHADAAPINTLILNGGECAYVRALKVAATWSYRPGYQVNPQLINHCSQSQEEPGHSLLHKD